MSRKKGSLNKATIEKRKQQEKQEPKQEEKLETQCEPIPQTPIGVG